MVSCEPLECLTKPIKNQSNNPFILKILQRNSNLTILNNFDMPGHTNLKQLHQIEETFDVYLQAKNDQLHP